MNEQLRSNYKALYMQEVDSLVPRFLPHSSLLLLPHASFDPSFLSLPSLRGKVSVPPLLPSQLTEKCCVEIERFFFCFA